MLFTNQSQSFFYLLSFLLAMSRLPRILVFNLLAHCSSCASVCVCVCVPNSCVYESKKKKGVFFFFLIQHGWAEKSGVAATLNMHSDQLAQLLTPTFTHKHTHTQSAGSGANKAAWPVRWRHTHSRPFVYVCLSPFFSFTHTSLLPVRGCCRLPHTPQVRAEQQQATEAWVLIAINTSSLQFVFVCACFCVRHFFDKLKKRREMCLPLVKHLFLKTRWFSVSSLCFSTGMCYYLGYSEWYSVCFCYCQQIP